MPTTIRLDDSRALQLIRNTKLWSYFPIFKNLALRAQSAETKINSGRTGCAPCAARKRRAGQEKLSDTAESVKEAIVGMPQESKEKLKQALGVDYIKISTKSSDGRPRELMF